MTIEHFTAQEFQAALPSGWECKGYEYGELTYHLPTIGPVKILIRSTIRLDGASAGTGEDSIRCFLVNDSGTPAGHNLMHYTTRVSGWQGRLAKVIATLQEFRRVSGDCPKCHIPKTIYHSNTTKNPNRYFAKCGRCSGYWVWLDAPTSQPYYHAVEVPLSRSTDNSKINPKIERTMEGLSVERGGGTTGSPANLSDRPNPALLQNDRDSGVSPTPLYAAELGLPPELVAPSSDDHHIAANAGTANPLSFLSKSPAVVRLAADPGDDSTVPAGESRPPFVPSKYQAAIYDFLQSGSGNGVVIATAGSGKTATIRNATPYLPKGAKVAAIAFNRRNALDLQKVMPEWVRASTFHSLGLSNLKRANGRVKVDDDKVWNLLHRIEDRGGTLADVIAEDGPAIRQVVSLVKSTLSPTDNDSLNGMIEHYGIPLNGNSEPTFDIVREVMKGSDRDTDTVDFGDMLYRCATGAVSCEKFDFILQDEAQDATQAQIEFVKRSLKPSGRLLAVGDPRQAIYSWAGSAIDSIDQLTRYHKASTLPLSITYRLPLSHVENVNKRFPDVGMESRDNAPDGVIGDRSYPDMLRHLVDGDLVICRVNAPLIEPCFELIRQGRKATIAGRDIGKGLTVLLSKVQKRNPGSSLPQLMSELRMYTEREVDKLTRVRKANQAATLQDQCDTLVALADGAMTVDDIRRKVAAVFSDDQKGVTFSSCHRAKGSEAENVYLYKPELIPHPMSAGSNWQLAAEDNVLFVSLTRSKGGLYMVSGQ